MLFLTKVPSSFCVLLKRSCSCPVIHGVRPYSPNAPATATASSGSPVSAVGKTPVELLKEKLNHGEIQPDPHQVRVTEALQVVYDSIKTYSPPKPSTGIGKWFSFGRAEKAVAAPKGLYIYGSVGGGKTMLMDMFYDCCAVSVRPCPLHTACVCVCWCQRESWVGDNLATCVRFASRLIESDVCTSTPS